MDDKLKLFLIVVLVAIAGYFGWPSENKPGFRENPDGTQEFFCGYKWQRGLDLQGGSELRLAIKRKELRTGVSVAEATHRAVETLNRRVNFTGLKEPRITTFGEDQILVQLPGIDFTEVQRVKQIITSSGKLEFKLVADEEVQSIWKQTGQAPQGYRVYSHYQTEDQRAHGSSGESVLIKDIVQMTGDDVKTASDHLAPEQGGFAVELRLTANGQRTFAKLTSENVNRQLAIILDDKLMSAPVIREKIPGGVASITGKFDLKEARGLATVLKSGSLPAGLEIVAENYVGPSLGADAIRRGVMAGLIALAAVLVFMIVFYRTAGVIANIALFMNVVLMVGLLAVFQATLTLPGIAGIILTMGMAVDSNIIIYERIREERDRGKPLLTAFEAGFDRAFWTVFDSNITTLIAGIVLYYTGSGPIKGFAVTLCVGILTTLFTALTCSQTMLRLLITSGLGPLKVTEFHMLRTFTNPKFPFMSIGKACILGSLALIVVTCGTFLARGDSNFGIDFNGGTIVNVRFNQPLSIEDVRKTMASIKSTEGGVEHPKYADAEVQAVLGGPTEAAEGKSAGTAPTEFAIRTSTFTQEVFKKDLLEAFAGKVSQPPFIFPTPAYLDKPGNAYHGGQRVIVNLATPMARSEFETKLLAMCKKLQIGDPGLAGKGDVDKQSTYEFVLLPGDNGRLGDLEAAIKDKDGGIPLTSDPFPSIQNIGPSVARDLKWQAITALVWSWVAMIIYLWFRFDFKFGLAAVVALIHDVLVCIGVQAVMYLVLPRSLGISLDMGLATVAAWLTIIGYSVNDTIVIFDRIRENMREMKREPLAVIMDASINQTLSRTILTSMTVFLTVIALFALTAHSGGGVAGFSFPMIVGVITGTYSSIYIASYLVLLWSTPKVKAA